MASFSLARDSKLASASSRTAVLGLLATLAFALAAFAAPASASASNCNSSTCSLSGSPSTAQIYFEMPRNTPVTMLCWTDNQWWNGTNRWFKVDSRYGRGYMNANQVSNQTRVGHC
jgi:hypothetical protein